MCNPFFYPSLDSRADQPLPLPCEAGLCCSLVVITERSAAWPSLAPGDHVGGPTCKSLILSDRCSVNTHRCFDDTDVVGASVFLCCQFTLSDCCAEWPEAHWLMSFFHLESVLFSRSPWLLVKSHLWQVKLRNSQPVHVCLSTVIRQRCSTDCFLSMFLLNQISISNVNELLIESVRSEYYWS